MWFNNVNMRLRKVRGIKKVREEDIEGIKVILYLSLTELALHFSAKSH